MSSIDAFAAALTEHGWRLLVAFTVSVSCVFVLRKSYRRWFGVQRAVWLWWLPVLASVVSQLPHPVSPSAALPPLVYWIARVPGALPAHGALPFMPDWRVVVMGVWMAGLVAAMLWTGMKQWRFRSRLRDATAVDELHLPCPVLRAGRSDMGPALVGLLKPRIVLPSDFRERYSVAERQLILAHEATHLRRRDVWWSLFAQGVAVLLWFHPLAWLALRALRHDQELACDATVLSTHGMPRRTYASAMLKTQPAALPLPVGCSWSSRHPLTERIAMLKSSFPTSRRKAAGSLLLCVLLGTSAGLAYAASATPATTAAQARYQLSVQVMRGDHTLAAPVLCMAAGQVAEIRQGQGADAWQLAFTPSASGTGKVNVHVTGDIGGAPGAAHLDASVAGPLGQMMSVMMGPSNADPGAVHVSFTPTSGCAAETADVSGGKITVQLTNVSARAAAQLIASRAGLSVSNPQALDEQLITFNFDHMPVAAALQAVASIDGKRASVSGEHVNILAK
ncbi:M56 family metallopeptidase [Dyella acidiphila]|uniref:Peptidase M56 n=1 Tax=Dyella acidiphila TaxID=2775866 RepID=A0ABR9G964_9GAMM|nr:M56 family metallopeptidase [Dyella acidiphila]MBE1160585.1 peptidase M56 [Dyella acidiphila]